MKTPVVQIELPLILARLQEYMYDHLPTEKHGKEWSEAFASAVRLGTDLSTIWQQYAAWMLDDPTDGVLRLTTTRDGCKAIRAIATLYRQGCTDEQRWQAAINAAEGKKARRGSFFTGLPTYATFDCLDAARFAADAAQYAAKAVRLSQNPSAAGSADRLSDAQYAESRSTDCAVAAVNSAIFAFGRWGHGELSSPACKRTITRHSEKLLELLCAPQLTKLLLKRCA
jgi:hypothetical protein